MKQKLLAFMLLLPTLSLAQGICKSDVLLNRQGHAVPLGSVLVCPPDSTGSPPCNSGTKSTLYSSPSLGSTITNPLTTDNDGRFAFCVATAGLYVIQSTYAGQSVTNTMYMVSPGDTAFGVLTFPGFSDDGATTGYVGTVTASRSATLTAIHVRANTPWTACSAAGTVSLYGKPQTTSESRHLLASLLVQAASHPSSQTSLHYTSSADAPGLSVPLTAGDELQLWWAPATSCAQYASGILVTADYEGTR